MMVFIGCLLSMIVSANAAAPRKLNCNGSLIEPAGSNSATKSLSLILGDAKSTSIDMGSGATPVSVTSNNKIQLKFVTRDFVGEYFHYTGDLFLIYKSGHLARLTCAA